MINPAVTDLACALIEKPSITPDDAGCQSLIIDQLTSIGFSTTPLLFDDTHNLWARYGDQGPLIVFVGHTDVVPPGELTHWKTPPFSPTIQDNILYGRGAADMKGSLAAMIIAAENFIQNQQNPHCSIGFLITSDEEGTGKNGTQRVVDYLRTSAIIPDYVIVGEPTAREHVGDVIKIGRRGSLNGHLTIYGKQGHVAYPLQANNAIHLSLQALQSLTDIEWDTGSEHFPPTHLQIANLKAGVGASNVIPGKLLLDFNIRYNPNWDVSQIKERVIKQLAPFHLNYQLNWERPSQPYYTNNSVLINSVQKAVSDCLGKTPLVNTEGGTSDGRFLAAMGCPVIEIGPCNATIHAHNECVDLQELSDLSQIFLHILLNLQQTQ